jgi:exosortase A-associated hydrolase 2
VVPALGDEMNKTRKMLTETGKLLNERGIALISADPFGTGDSEGRFEDADLSTWVGDLRRALNWAIEQGTTVRGLIAVRSGALFAGLLADESGHDFATTTMWQPTATGDAFFKQTLRARALSQLVDKGARESTEGLMESIRAGDTVFAAGYGLNRRLVDPIAALKLEDCLNDRLGHVEVIETVRLAESCESVETVGAHSITRARIQGQPYWNSTETVCDRSVVERTARVLEERLHARQ